MPRQKKKQVPAVIPAVITPVSVNSGIPVVIFPRLLRIQDAALYLSATTWQVETLLREKKISSMILGKRQVVDIQDLNKWIDAQKAA
jgi:hypothetical protein